MDKIAILFTMKSCPHCHTFKNMLKESDIDFIERDIDEYEEEYELFVEASGSDYVPSFMLIENPESDKPKSGLFAPESGFNDIDEGLNIIKEFFKR